MSERPRRHSALLQLTLARVREFYREPEAVFWVYGFPVIMVLALGLAFRNKPVERIRVDVEAGAGAENVVRALEKTPSFQATVFDAETCQQRLRVGKTELVIVAGAGDRALTYRYDPTRPESVMARNAVDDALQRSAGRVDPIAVHDSPASEIGGRYVDFLVPGLLGAGVMGGGLWGVGFVTVNFRIRRLLKRFLATPMSKTTFLGAILLSRPLFMIPEIVILLAFARFAFGVSMQGSWLALCVVIALGMFAFSGIGLFVACRATTLEAVSGLMNLVMLPMWILSGIFFSAERFPDELQPMIQALPLTLLIDSLRAIMLEGAPLATQLGRVAGLLAWGILTFVFALRWFRWE